MFLRAAEEIVRILTSAVPSSLDVEFVVVGAGPLRKFMEVKGMAITGARFTFLGWLDRPALAGLLPTLDVVLNPSLRSSETFCIANLEAMSSGVPVVSLGVAGIGEYLNPRTNGTAGLIVGPPPGTADDRDGTTWPALMAHLAVTVLTNGTMHRALRRTSRAAAQIYDSERMVQSYGALYQRLAAEMTAVGPMAPGPMAPKNWHGATISASSVQEVFLHMASSEMAKLSLDVAEAERSISSLVTDTGRMHDAFALLMRGAVLGITRFPVLAHIPSGTRWWKIDNVPLSAVAQFRLLNETSWWPGFGQCPTVLDAAAAVAAVRRKGEDRPSEWPAHTAQILRFLRPEIMSGLSRVLVGVARSIGDGEPVTLIDGNHRAISFVGAKAADEKWAAATLLLGVDPHFGRNWTGNFFCRR